MRIGLISDTHMPRRWKALPSIVFDTFSSCDMILHAGDVGELWVLDQLSVSAPVVAVHGNDETEEATAALPFLQTVVCEGHRIVLTHSHFPDRQVELERRKDDSWHPKLAYRANFGKLHEAEIVVSGHTHIPMKVFHDGILLVNPGAIASGNVWTKQTLQTIAVMTLEQGKSPDVEFINIQTGKDYVPDIDWDAGFMAQARKGNAVIFSDELLEIRSWLIETVYSRYDTVLEDRLLPLCHEAWAGKRGIITLADVVEALKADDIPDSLIDLLAQNDLIMQYL